MRQVLRWPTPTLVIFASLTLLSISLTPIPSQALTASLGQPYHGRLVNGIPFPRQFSGYQLREESRTYTTPEVIGAMLDAIDAVQKQFPGTSEIYLGDFSLPGGGPVGGHRSHQNGRDVDVGMFAKGNRTLDSFAPMNEENLDVPRTWAFIESLLCSQRVQYLFVDQRIQNLLYDYARSRGVDPGYLDRLFANNRGAVIQHVRNHVDHMHIRFYTPWSTMAAQVSNLDEQKRSVIEMAQQSYMPKKVYYYAKGNEKSLDVLARSFGVNRNDLCRWNEIRGGEILSPGKCLVFYKRGFEFEPVHLAQSLQPDSVPETPSYQVASLRPSAPSASDASVSMSTRERAHQPQQKKSSDAVTFTYKAKRGDTVEKVARRNGIDARVLARANGLKPGDDLKPGQKISLAGLKIPAGEASCVLTGEQKAGKGKPKAAIASVNAKGKVRVDAISVSTGKGSAATKGKDSPVTGSIIGVTRSGPIKSVAQSSTTSNAKASNPTKAPAASATAQDKSKQAVAAKDAKDKPVKTSAAPASAAKDASLKSASPPRSIPFKAPPTAGIAKNTKALNKKVN
jgi:murein endopeptidase/LysM repeat protein